MPAKRKRTPRPRRISARNEPKTALGRKLAALRGKYIAGGGELLDAAGIDAERRARRGGLEGAARSTRVPRASQTPIPAAVYQGIDVDTPAFARAAGLTPPEKHSLAVNHGRHKAQARAKIAALRQRLR